MKFFSVLSLSCTLLLAGCGSDDVAVEDTASNSDSYVAASEPTGGVPVGEARENATDGEAITLVGVVGGSREPFVDGIAAFTIVDPKVPYCQPEEGCPTPWDYCCKQDQVKDNIATVKVVDDSGAPVATDARELVGAEPLSTVVVKGTATRDDQGNLSVAASEVFVRP